RSLKRQLGVRRAGVFLWAGGLSERDFDRLLSAPFACVVPSLGEGFCGPAVQALLLGKPVLAPRHTALADYLPADHPYSFATGRAAGRSVGAPLGFSPPSSSWHVPEPFALAYGFARLVSDSPERRAEACRKSREACEQWCSVEPVRGLLAGELAHLDAR